MGFERILDIAVDISVLVLVALGVVLVIMLIRVASEIKSVIAKAESVADGLIAASDVIRKTAAPAAVSSVILKVVKSIFNKASSKEKEK